MDKLKETFSLIWGDLDAYAYRRGLAMFMAWLVVFLYPACWPVLVYRFGYYITYYFRVPIVKQLFYAIYFFLKRFTELLTTIEISNKAEIGKGLFIGHLGGIVIGQGSKIGKHASFHQGVTIGGAGRGKDHGSPTIGDNVYFSAGCKVIGKVNIGNNVVIGANAVVVSDVPDNASVGGVPAKVLNYKGSYDFIHFRGKPARTNE